MKQIEDYAEGIEKLSRDSCYFNFEKFEVYHRGLQITLNNHGEDWSYVLSVEGNDLFGYNLISSRVMLDYGQREEQEKDFRDLDKIVILNEWIAGHLKFNNLVVSLRDEISKKIYEERGYQFESSNENQVAVKKIK
jgi:hypothetical protein